MPFNSGGQTYQGGNFLYGGLSNFGANLGEGATKAIADMRKAEEDQSADNLIIEHAKSTGQITPEQYTQFINGSRTQKNGIVAGLARNLATDLAQQEKQARAESLLANTELRRQQVANFNFTPRTVNIPSQVDQQGFPFAQPVNPADQVQRPGIQMIETRKGVFEPAGQLENDGAGVGDVETKPLTIGNVTVPGFGIVSRKGSKQFQIVQFGTDAPVFQQDAITKAWYKVGRNESRRPRCSKRSLQRKLADRI